MLFCLVHTPKATGLESVVVDSSPETALLLSRLEALEAEVNYFKELTSKLSYCNRIKRFYKKGANTNGSCVALRNGGGTGNNNDDTTDQLSETPPICHKGEYLSWSKEGWVCLIQNSAPTPPTCEEGTETLHWFDGAWVCLRITVGDNNGNGNDNNNNSNNNNNTNINEENSIHIKGSTQSSTLSTEKLIGKCTLRKTHETKWKCISSGSGVCKSTQKCDCEKGYRQKEVLRLKTKKSYLCIQN